LRWRGWRASEMERTGVQRTSSGSGFMSPLGRRVTADQVLTKLKGASKKEAALGALIFTSVGLALTYGVIEYLLGGSIDWIFIFMEVVHFSGILILIRKLLKEKSCEGLSVRTQELTALYLVARVFAGALFEGNHHTLLDVLTLVVTCVVLFHMNTTLKHTVDYKHDMSRKTQVLYILVPCAVAAFFINPAVKMELGPISWVCNMLWAFATYVEAISVFPQLMVMKHISDEIGYFERKSTADYVFALGITRFFGCASWLLQPATFTYVYTMTLKLRLWGIATLISEIVQTFILADFCYYYIKSVADGSGLVRFNAVMSA